MPIKEHKGGCLFFMQIARILYNTLVKFSVVNISDTMYNFVSLIQYRIAGDNYVESTRN